MTKRALGFAHVGEAGFVDQAVADRPRVAEIVLLIALPDRVAESRHVRSRRLEIVKRAEIFFVGNVVVGRKILFLVNAVVETKLSLVAAVVLLMTLVLNRTLGDDLQGQLDERLEQQVRGAAQWIGEHPNWTIKKYHCEGSNREEKTDARGTARPA